MAQEGFLSVVVGHPESSLRSVRRHASGEGLQVGLADLVTDPAAYEARFQDIDAAKAWARARCAQGPAVLAGHSMGAATVMLTAGARNHLGVAGTDDFDLYVALSPQGPGTIFPDHAWSGIHKGVL
jgi:predicted dienelactone hydrolase